MDNTQTATSKNHEGSAQGENTEKTTITGKDSSMDDEEIQKKNSKRNNKKEEYPIYCDDDQLKIKRKERKFWENQIPKYLKPFEQDKNKEKAATEALIELRNKVCLFVFLLNAFLVTIMFSLTQVNAFKDALSVKFTCGGNDVSIVPISILFAVVFGLLLFIQFICMLYHRISTLIHITAETKILEDEHDKTMKKKLKMAKFFTDPTTSKTRKPKMTSDKKTKDLEMNTSDIMPEKEEKITSMNDIVRKQMDHLEELKDTLTEEEIRIAQNVKRIIKTWKNIIKPEKGPAMVGVVHGICPNLKTEQEHKRGKKNKVEPEPQPSTYYNSTPPNSHLQNQEPISGTEINV